MRSSRPRTALWASSHSPIGRAAAARRTTTAPVKARALRAGLPLLQPPTLKDPALLQALARVRRRHRRRRCVREDPPDALLTTPRLGMVNVHASLLPTLPRRRAGAPRRNRGRHRNRRDHHAGRAGARCRTDARESRQAHRCGRHQRGCRGGPRRDWRRAPRGDPGPPGSGTRFRRRRRTTRTPPTRTASRRTTARWTGHARRANCTTSYGDCTPGLTHSPSAAVPGSSSCGPGSWKAKPLRLAPVVIAQGDRLRVATGAGLIDLLEVQAEGKRPMTARDFLAGRALQAGSQLTSAP